jgi:hypothetical protein
LDPLKYRSYKDVLTIMNKYYEDFKKSVEYKLSLPISSICGVQFFKYRILDGPERGVLILKVDQVPTFEYCKGAMKTADPWTQRTDFTTDKSASTHCHYYIMADYEALLYTVALMYEISSPFQKLYDSKSSIGSKQILLELLNDNNPCWKYNKTKEDEIIGTNKSILMTSTPVFTLPSFPAMPEIPLEEKLKLLKKMKLT